MEFRLLGPVEAYAAGGRRVPFGGPTRLTVLAALLVDAGRPIPINTLVDRVWDQAPPAGARDRLYVHLSRIRATIANGDGAADRPEPLRRQVGGYLLAVDPDQVDLHRFRRLAAADPAGAAGRAETLRTGLALWRGPALAEIPGSWASGLRDSLQQQRLGVLVRWAEAELSLGRHAEVIDELREHCAQHPLVEPLAAHLIRALHRAGRRAEALDQYAATRRHLADELGTEPGADLQAIHQAILRGQLDLPPARSAPAARPPQHPPPAAPREMTPMPAQLPADVPGFTGRADELARLDHLLASAVTGAHTAVVISVVCGPPGVGKTALAIHWAHRVADRFPDGQLYVNLRGFDPGGQVMDPTSAVRGFLDALGVPPQRIPADLHAQAALYRSLLNNKRMLVVLDNARDVDQVRPLLPGTPTAVALVTSRNQLTGLVADGAHPVSVDLLTAPEARELLAYRLGPDRVGAEPQAIEQIIAGCAGLALALAVVAARAATHPSFGLTALAAELSQAAGPVGRLDAGEVVAQVRAVFSWSYTTLTPAAARLFRLLGLHPGPDVSVAAAASLTGVPPADARRLLADLTRAGLLAEHTPGRYAFHDLLAAYAADLTRTTDPDDQRRAAITRLLDHYTHTAHTADRHLYPARDPIQVPLTPPAPGTTPEQPTDQQEALDWLTIEHPVLLAAQRLAADARLDTHTWQLAWAVDTFLSRRGHWHDLAGSWHAAVAAADRLTDAAAAYACRLLARTDTRLGDYRQAHSYLRRAQDLFAEAGNQAGQAHSHIDIAILWGRQDRPDRALQHAQQALTLYWAASHRRGHANALNAVGWYHARLGDYAQALTHCRRALTLSQQAGDRYGEAGAWDSLGYAHHHLGYHTKATDCYQHALTLARGLGDRYNEATTLTRLGETHHADGQPDQARTAWTTALHILTDLDHPDADAVRTKLAGL